MSIGIKELGSQFPVTASVTAKIHYYIIKVIIIFIVQIIMRLSQKEIHNYM